MILYSNVKGLSGQGFSLTADTDHVNVGSVTKLQTRETLIVTESKQNARVFDEHLHCILIKYYIRHVSAGETL